MTWALSCCRMPPHRHVCLGLRSAPDRGFRGINSRDVVRFENGPIPSLRVLALRGDGGGPARRLRRLRWQRKHRARRGRGRVRVRRQRRRRRGRSRGRRRRKRLPARDGRRLLGTVFGSGVPRAPELHDKPERHGLRPGGEESALQRRCLRSEQSGGDASAHHSGNANVQHLRRLHRQLRRRDDDRLQGPLLAHGRSRDHERAARRADRASGGEKCSCRASQKCTDNAVPAARQPLPRKRSEGDMPQMALLTGGCDDLGCFMKSMGIDASEFTAPHARRAGSTSTRARRLGGNGATLSSGTAGDCTGAGCPLWASKRASSRTTSRSSRASAAENNQTKPAAGMQALHDWLGRRRQGLREPLPLHLVQEQPRRRLQGRGHLAGTRASRPDRATTTSTRPSRRGWSFSEWLGNVEGLERRTAPSCSTAWRTASSSVNAPHAALDLRPSVESRHEVPVVPDADRRNSQGAGRGRRDQRSSVLRQGRLHGPPHERQLAQDRRQHPVRLQRREPHGAASGSRVSLLRSLGVCLERFHRAAAPAAACEVMPPGAPRSAP